MNKLITPDVTGPLMANSHPGSYTGQDAYNDMFPVLNSTGGGVSATITSSYWKGPGTRNGEEREFIVFILKEDIQCPKNATASAD